MALCNGYRGETKRLCTMYDYVQVHTILRSENCNFSTWKILFLFLLFFRKIMTRKDLDQFQRVFLSKISSVDGLILEQLRFTLVIVITIIVLIYRVSAGHYTTFAFHDGKYSRLPIIRTFKFELQSVPVTGSRL